MSPSYDDLLRDRRLRQGKLEAPDLSDLKRLNTFGDLLLSYATDSYELGKNGTPGQSEAAQGLWAIVRSMDQELLETQRERDRLAEENAGLRDELEEIQRDVRSAL